MVMDGSWIRSCNFAVYILLIVPLIVYRWWPKILLISSPLILFFKFATFIYFQHYLSNLKDIKDYKGAVFNILFIFSL